LCYYRGHSALTCVLVQIDIGPNRAQGDNAQLSQTPMTSAYERGHYELVETLLESGAHDVGAIEKGELLESYLAANADQFTFPHDA
jgi:hypothetical protein